MIVDKRPVNLDLTTIRFPITAIVSILHRISGVGLFVLAPVIVWFWTLALSDSTSFATVSAWMQSGGVKFIVWLFLSALAYHLIAGIKHLIMDLGYGEEVASAQRAAYISLASFVGLAIIGGIWLWQV